MLDGQAIDQVAEWLTRATERDELGLQLMAPVSLLPLQAVTQCSRACPHRVDMHGAVISRGSWGRHGGGQGWTVPLGGEMRGPAPHGVTLHPVSTPLNHRLQASPGQAPKWNLAWHQREKLSAVASPAKETPEG